MQERKFIVFSVIKTFLFLVSKSYKNTWEPRLSKTELQTCHRFLIFYISMKNSFHEYENVKLSSLQNDEFTEKKKELIEAKDNGNKKLINCLCWILLVLVILLVLCLICGYFYYWNEVVKFSVEFKISQFSLFGTLNKKQLSSVFVFILYLN